ncbi:MAG: hypothetical protein CMC72_01705 [Flavobacteriaceae bacterium]|nr:hypothetical protein [Flavobacteriaceae bacterium]
MNRFLFVVLILVFFGCNLTKKSKSEINLKNLSTAASLIDEATKFERTISNKKLISELEKKTPNFNFISYASQVRVKNNNSINQFNLGIKIHNNNKILLTGSLIIPLFKALLTTDEVTFYERINRSYFKRKYSSLPAGLENRINYNNIQNMLLGIPFVGLDQVKWKQSFTPQLIKLQSVSRKNKTRLNCEFDLKSLRLKKQALFLDDVIFEVNYSEYQSVLDSDYPNKIQIKFLDDKSTITIEMNIKISSLDSEPNFSFKIPKGYTEISL